MIEWSKYDCIVLPITLLIIILLSLTIFLVLRKKDRKIKNIPLIIIASIMLILEVVKQVLDIIDGYSTWTIPLHFCSLFLYFYPLAVFTKGKVQEFGKTMSLVSSVLMFALFYFNPGSIIGEATANIFESFSTFHTIIYHHLVILFLFTSLLLNFYSFNKRNYVHILIGFTLYAVVMLPFAYVLQTNYCNILVSNIPFMESFRLFAGQVVYTIVMLSFAIISGLLIVTIQYAIHKLITKRRKA